MVRKTFLFLLILMSTVILPSFVMAQATLWNQPLSVGNSSPYHNQDYDNNPESDMWISDDFENTQTWHISSIFLPGDFVKDIFGASTLGNAKSLSWYIFADDGGKPAGYPGDGLTTPVWSIALNPSDPQISITKGSGGDPSNVTLNLTSPPRIPPGQYWFIFSPEMRANLYGEHGRQPSDTAYGFPAQVIQPTSADGFPAIWTSVLDPIVPWVEERFPALTKQDFAFRLEGSSFPSNMDANPRSLYFGNVLTNQTSVSRTVSISNTGGTSFVISSISASSGAFAVVSAPSNGCSLSNHTLNGGSSCNVSVTFTPSAAGAQSAALNINTNLTPALAQLPLSGTGIQAEGTTTEGTIGTVITFSNAPLGFTDKKGKVYIYDGTKKINTKIANGGWTNDSITATVNKAFLPGTYNVRIEFKRDKAKVVYEAGTFTFKKPEIDTLTATEGIPGDPITIRGNFFSTKKGKVYLEYQNKNKNCKVTSWSMDSITFEVPKGITPGAYPLKVSNKVGISAEDIDFTIK